MKTSRASAGFCKERTLMENSIFERLKALVNAMGVSGEEQDVRALLKKDMIADEW